MNKFSNSAGKLYALSAGESKPSTVTVLHLLPACYSLCCVNAPRSSRKNTVLRHCVIPLIITLSIVCFAKQSNSDDTSAIFNYTSDLVCYDVDKFR